MGARKLQFAIIGILFVFIAVGCAIQPIDSPAKIGLLAPFEGRYRDIGYEALYAVRLAITESGRDDITLLAVDDGGTLNTAQSRARALADDPLVKAVIVLGYDAAAAADSFEDVPFVVVENWFIEPTETTFILGSPEVEDLITVQQPSEITEASQIEAPAVGGIIFGLEGFREMRADLMDIQFLSSSTLPSEDFRSRYINSDQFTPEPSLLATLSYDATNLLLANIPDDKITRSEVTENLQTHQFEGINGLLAFQNGYWREAPLYTYTFGQNQELILADNPVE